MFSLVRVRVRRQILSGWWGVEVEDDEVSVFTPSETPGVRSWLVLAVVFCPEFSLEYLRGTINKRLVLARQGLSSD